MKRERSCGLCSSKVGTSHFARGSARAIETCTDLCDGDSSCGYKGSFSRTSTMSGRFSRRTEAEPPAKLQAGCYRRPRFVLVLVYDQ